jgi:hypothetical protein
MHDAVGRLNDTASHTRKNAVILIKTMVEYNPFGPALGLKEWKQKFEAMKSASTERKSELEAKIEDLKRQALEPEADKEALQDEMNALADDNEGAESKEMFMLTFYSLALEFVRVLEESAIPKCIALLRSSTQTDVLEAILFFGVCHTFGVEAAGQGMHRALALVWREEPTVRSKILECYSNVLLVPRGGFTGPTPRSSSDAQLTHADALAIASQLVEFTNSGLSIGDQASFEQLIGLYVRAEKSADGKGVAYIPPAVVTALWEIFSSGGSYGCAGHGDAEEHPTRTPEELALMTVRARGALSVLSGMQKPISLSCLPL